MRYKFAQDDDDIDRILPKVLVARCKTFDQSGLESEDSGSRDLLEIMCAYGVPVSDSDLSYVGVSEWYCTVGDSVELNQPIFRVMSDMYMTDMLSPVAGVIEKIVFPAKTYIEGISEFTDITLCRIRLQRI